MGEKEIAWVLWASTCPRDAGNRQALSLARKHGEPRVLLPGMTRHFQLTVEHGRDTPYVVVDGRRIPPPGEAQEGA